MRAVRTLPTLLLAGMLCASCGDEGLQQVNPMLDTDREAIDFGPWPVLFDAVEQVRLFNIGGAPLEFSSIRIEGDPAFRILEPVRSIWRGGEARLEVLFVAGEQRAYEATLVIESNDPRRPVVEIPLAGEGTTAAAAVIEPRVLDFGRVGENRSAVRQVRITSRGSAALRIRTIAFKPGTSEAYAFVGSTRTPQDLRAPVEGEADAFAEVTLRFAPTTGETETSGVLVLETSDPSNTLVEIPLRASINRQPVADAGDDGMVAVGDLVALDGSGSHDPDGDDPITHAWRIIEQPAGSGAALEAGDTAFPLLQTDLPGAYVLELVVTDSAGLSSRPDYVTITAITAESLVVELVWDHPVADLDLHFIEDGAAMFSARDCHGFNPNPDFGVQGDPFDDPVHSGDVLSGFGPETVTYEEPADGRYHVAVRYASAQGAADTRVRATVRIYLYGVIHRELTRTFEQPGTVWNAASVDWPTGSVTVPSGAAP